MFYHNLAQLHKFYHWSWFSDFNRPPHTLMNEECKYLALWNHLLKITTLSVFREKTTHIYCSSLSYCQFTIISLVLSSRRAELWVHIDSTIYFIMKEESKKRPGKDNWFILGLYWGWLTWSDTPYTRLEWLVIRQTLEAQKQGTKIFSALYSGAWSWAFIIWWKPSIWELSIRPSQRQKQLNNSHFRRLVNRRPHVSVIYKPHLKPSQLRHPHFTDEDEEGLRNLQKSHRRWWSQSLMQEQELLIITLSAFYFIQ